jgi:cyclophilin family peptidyl-prolyl cis-trans isomerase
MGILGGYGIFYKTQQESCRTALLAQHVQSQTDCNVATAELQRQVTSGGNDMNADLHLFQLQGAMQRRHQMECLQQFGQDPYRIEFWVAIPGDDGEHAFEIQLEHVNDMPFTVHTLMQLIDLGLYVETRISARKAGTVVGGNPTDAAVKARSHLMRAYAQQGFGITPFALKERAPRTECEMYSFGVRGKSPEFIIFTNDKQATDDDVCFGKVVSGVETLEMLQQLSRSDSALIVEVKILGDETDAGKHDEL